MICQHDFCKNDLQARFQQELFASTISARIICKHNSSKNYLRMISAIMMCKHEFIKIDLQA
jgi:hypothetical protein